MGASALTPVSTLASSVTEPWISDNLINPTLDDDSPSWWSQHN
jgi:hypothetical protein